VSRNAYPRIRAKIVEGANSASFSFGDGGVDLGTLPETVEDTGAGKIDPFTNEEDARTLIAHYVLVLLKKDKVPLQRLERYLTLNDVDVISDFVLFVRERDGKEDLINDVFGARKRINKDPKASNALHSVHDVKEAELGVIAVTERYYHVQDVKKGDVFSYRTREGTIRLAKEELPSRVVNGQEENRVNFRPVWKYITQLDDKEKASGVVYML
jgi:hypothetical protein